MISYIPLLTFWKRGSGRERGIFTSLLSLCTSVCMCVSVCVCRVSVHCKCTQRPGVVVRGTCGTVLPSCHTSRKNDVNWRGSDVWLKFHTHTHNIFTSVLFCVCVCVCVYCVSVMGCKGEGFSTGTYSNPIHPPTSLVFFRKEEGKLERE